MKLLPFSFLFAVLISCAGPSQQQKAFDVFNEGVAFSLDAAAEQDAAKAAGLERRAIAKFEQTLALDSTHGMARAALGHSHYMLDEYKPAIRWFEASNRIDTASAPVYRELGICKIALNSMEAGWDDLQTAFRLDSLSNPANVAETRKVTADDLFNMGCKAFEYGETYAVQGDAEKAIGFKEFGLNILFLAYGIESSRKDIAAGIAERAGKLGDVARQNKYRKLAR